MQVSLRKYQFGGEILENASYNTIKNLQTFLVSKNKLTEKDVDGHYGPVTKAAYESYLNDENNARTQRNPQLMRLEDIKKYEEEFNNNDNETIINKYHSLNTSDSPYIVDDKVNNKVRVYKNGILIREYNAIHGKNSTSPAIYNKKSTKSKISYTVKPGDYLGVIAKNHGVSLNDLISANNITNPNLIKPGQVIEIPGQVSYQLTKIDPDEMTVTYVDNNGNIKNLEGNLTTPAGIYFSTKSGNYHGAPSFIRRTQNQINQNDEHGIPSNMHARTITEKANTNGCTGLSKEDLIDLGNITQGYNQIPTYILPANDQNKFKIRNGELTFSSHDLSKTPSHNVMNYTPINKITFNSKDFDEKRKKVVREYAQGLIKNKEQLQKDLKINNDTYNQLAKYSFGILGAESNYGDEHNAFSNLIHAIRKVINSNASSPDYKSKYSTYGQNNDNNSLGLTQIRYSSLNDSQKELFKKYGIDKDSLVYNPEKAAIATVIKLATEYLNQGMDYDKAIRSWNYGRAGYVDRVKKNSERFNIYQNYSTFKLGGKLISRK